MNFVQQPLIHPLVLLLSPALSIVQDPRGRYCKLRLHFRSITEGNSGLSAPYNSVFSLRRQAGYLLRTRAILLGVVAFLFLFSAQLAVRYFIDLPTLFTIVNQSDRKDVLRVNNALSQRLAVYENRVADNALWDDAYEFVQSPHEQFLASNFDSRTLQDNEIDGVIFLDAAGDVVWQFGLEFGQGDTKPMLEQPPMGEEMMRKLMHVAPHLPQQGEIAKRVGYVRTPKSPVVFVAYPIFPTSYGDGTQLNAGTLIMWTWLDRRYINSVAEQTDLDLAGQFLPDGTASLAPMWRYLLTEDIRPRDKDNRIYWLLRDVNDEPLMMLWITLDSLGFETELFSDAIVAGLFAATVLLLGLAWVVRRWLVLPLNGLEQQMERITTSARYDLRLEVDSYEELNRMAGQFNLLLEEVCEREKQSRRKQEELRLASISDALTGLANRRYLDQFMDDSWLKCLAKASTYSLVLIDIDHFKKFNDYYGHAAGDRILKEVAKLLRDQQPAHEALTARYGGEEFCMVLLGASQSVLESLCERICKVIAGQGMEHQASELGIVTVSVGAVIADASQPDVRQLAHKNALRTIFKAADQALYDAKRTGRNQVCMGHLF